MMRRWMMHPGNRYDPFPAIISDRDTSQSRLELCVGLRRWLVTRGQAFGGKSKVIGHADFDSTFRRQFIRIAVGIDRNSIQSHCGQQFGHARGQASSALSEMGYPVLQMRYIFVHSQGPQMFEGALLDL